MRNGTHKLTEPMTEKFRSSLFKGLQVQDRVLVARRNGRNPFSPKSAQQGVAQCPQALGVGDA